MRDLRPPALGIEGLRWMSGMVIGMVEAGMSREDIEFLVVKVWARSNQIDGNAIDKIAEYQDQTSPEAVCDKIIETSLMAGELAKLVRGLGGGL